MLPNLLTFWVMCFLKDSTRFSHEYYFGSWLTTLRNWSRDADIMRPDFNHLREIGLAKPKPRPQPEPKPSGPRCIPYETTKRGDSSLYFESMALAGIIAEVGEQGHLLPAAPIKGKGLLGFKQVLKEKELRVTRPMWQLYWLSYLLLNKRGYLAEFQVWLTARGRVGTPLKSLLHGIDRMDSQGLIAASDVSCDQVRGDAKTVLRRSFGINPLGCEALSVELAAIGSVLAKLNYPTGSVGGFAQRPAQARVDSDVYVLPRWSFDRHAIKQENP